MPAHKKKYSSKTSVARIKPLTIEQINQYKTLPVLTKAQIAQVLQIPESTVLQLSRRRAKHRLPVFRVGKTIGATYAALERWIVDRQGEVMSTRTRRVA